MRYVLHNINLEIMLKDTAQLRREADLDVIALASPSKDIRKSSTVLHNQKCLDDNLTKTLETQATQYYNCKIYFVDILKHAAELRREAERYLIN